MRSRLPAPGLSLAYNCFIGYIRVMNFNVYLDRTSASQLDRIARKTSKPRNALIRQAVRMWLDRNAETWPTEVLEFDSEPSLLPFEAHRGDLAPVLDDPFETATRPTGSPRRRARPRSR